MREFKEEFTALATMLAENDPPVPMGMVNFMDPYNQAVMYEYDISGSPQVMFMIDGKKADWIKGWDRNWLYDTINIWIGLH